MKFVRDFKTHRVLHTGPWINLAPLDMIFASIRFAVADETRMAKKLAPAAPVLTESRGPQVRDLTCSSPRTIQIVLRLPALRLFSFIQDKKSIDSRVRSPPTVEMRASAPAPPIALDGNGKRTGAQSPRSPLR